MIENKLFPSDLPYGYFKLPRRRQITRPEWPQDLLDFFSMHEGLGFALQNGPLVQVAKVDEVFKVGWVDLKLSPDPPHAGWDNFTGFALGGSDYGDRIVYVVTAPGIPTGSILALGVGAMSGPAGDDKDGPVGALVLSDSLKNWIARMERLGPMAHGIYLDPDLPDWVSESIESEIVRLNPFSKWANTSEEE